MIININKSLDNAKLFRKENELRPEVPLNDFDVAVHPEGEHISDHIRKWGSWEAYTTEVLLELFRRVPQDTIFVDVGANIGWFSLVAAAQGFHTISIEPVFDNICCFNKSIAKNEFHDLITMYPFAVGSGVGNVEITTSKNNMGLCSSRTLPELDRTGSEICQVRKLDDCLKLHKGDMIMKMDVEEAELDALKGALDVFGTGRVKYLIIEVSNYDKEFFSIVRRFYQYAIQIGFDGDEGHKVALTNYLSDMKYRQTVEQVDAYMRTDTAGIKQKQILFYNDL